MSKPVHVRGYFRHGASGVQYVRPYNRSLPAFHIARHVAKVGIVFPPILIIAGIILAVAMLFWILIFVIKVISELIEFRAKNQLVFSCVIALAVIFVTWLIFVSIPRSQITSNTGTTATQEIYPIQRPPEETHDGSQTMPLPVNELPVQVDSTDENSKKNVESVPNHNQLKQHMRLKLKDEEAISSDAEHDWHYQQDDQHDQEFMSDSN